MESDPAADYEYTYDFSKAQRATMILALREYIASQRGHNVFLTAPASEERAFLRSEIEVATTLLEKLS